MPAKDALTERVAEAYSRGVFCLQAEREEEALASFEEAVKIDHPYYLTEPTMTAYLRRAGFEVARTDYAADHLHINYMCGPVDPEPGALPPGDEVAAMLREIRFVQNAPGPR